MFGPGYTRMRFVHGRSTIVDSADHVSRWDKQSDRYHIVQYKILAMPNCDGHYSGWGTVCRVPMFGRVNITRCDVAVHVVLVAVGCYIDLAR